MLTCKHLFKKCAKALRRHAKKHLGRRTTDSGHSTHAEANEAEEFESKPSSSSPEATKTIPWYDERHGIEDITIPMQLFSELQRATDDYTHLEALEKETNDKVAALHIEFQEAEVEIQNVTTGMREAEAKDPNSREVLRMQKKLRKLLDKRARIFREKDDVEWEMKKQASGFTNRSAGLFELWREIMKKANEELDLDEPDSEEASSIHQDEEVATVGIEKIGPECVPKEQEQQEQQQEKQQPLESQVDPDALIRSHKFFRNVLASAEWRLETRHERFDEQLKNMHDALALGYMTELDMERMEHRHFLETREMTQDVINAEKGLDAAKKALLHAGIQPPGSDVSSGFLDDPEDGYLLSSDEAYNPEDCPGILYWLEHMRDQELFPAHQPAPAPEDVDPRPSRDPEMWESASLIAPSRQKRRIDTWRSRAEATGARAEGPPTFAVPDRVSSRGWLKRQARSAAV